MRFADIQEGRDGYWIETKDGDHLGPARCVRKLPSLMGFQGRSEVQMQLPDGRKYWFYPRMIQTPQKARAVMKTRAEQRQAMEEMMATVQDYTGPDFEYRLTKTGNAVIRVNLDSGRLLLWLLDLIEDPYVERLRPGQTVEKMLMRELRGKKVHCTFERVNGRPLVGEMQIGAYGASLLLTRVLEERVSGTDADPISLLG